MCGPCVIESEQHAMETAEFLKELYASLDLNLIYKSSYDKANRSSYHSFRGPGLEKGLKILEKIRKELDIPVITDVHTPEEATAAGAVCDIIQIPAFLCRQTDLVTAAGKTGAVINVKKGQFMAPWDMVNVIDKIVSTGNDQIILATTQGQAIRFKEKDIQVMGRNAAGVKAIRLKGSDVLAGLDIIKADGEKNQNLLVVTANGFAKQTPLKEYKIQRRGGSGIKTSKITPKTGALITIQLISPEIQNVLAFSIKGQALRTELKNIRVAGRATQGVKIMNLEKEDKLIGITCL
jgi:DNA gyrase/topoisomerase IV subunit A